jgi:hypothetical protein
VTSVIVIESCLVFMVQKFCFSFIGFIPIVLCLCVLLPDLECSSLSLSCFSFFWWSVVRPFSFACPIWFPELVPICSWCWAVPVCLDFICRFLSPRRSPGRRQVAHNSCGLVLSLACCLRRALRSAQQGCRLDLLSAATRAQGYFFFLIRSSATQLSVFSPI